MPIIFRNDYVDALHWRAQAYNAKGDYDRAIADLDIAIPLSEFRPLFELRGLAYSRKGLNDRAIADFDHLIQLDPHWPDVYYYRGVAHEAAGHLTLARTDLRKQVEVYGKEDWGQVEEETKGALARVELKLSKSGAASPSTNVTSAAPSVASSTPATFLASSSSAQKRVALVIGNGSYKTVAQLPNPPRDAAAIGELFRSAGFQNVAVETNVGVEAMRKALRSCRLALQGGTRPFYDFNEIAETAVPTRAVQLRLAKTF
ncbi:caspase family protein [Methylosinus sp. Ce-a6]|uniref:caspase family protein n=1 Tax=Methylosinus sp. Ce-a6 TaxID=2172005 RepID=UPI001359F878|nr:caspase family protein [Methylosinus sp. Ce-a6]